MRLKRKPATDVTVDPGLQGTGVSVWDHATWGQKVVPLEAFNLYVNTSDEWNVRVQLLTQKLIDVLKVRRVKRLFVEYPAFWEGSVKGRTAAVNGDLLKLTFLIGCFAEAARQLGIEVFLIEVSWKGQLSKKNVEARVKSCIPGVVELKPESHTWDSIGLGLFCKGVCFK